MTTLRTSDEALASYEALVPRMEALVREMAGAEYARKLYPAGMFSEAREIVAMLPQPVDEYAPLARGICYAVLMARGASSEMIAAEDI